MPDDLGLEKLIEIQRFLLARRYHLSEVDAGRLTEDELVQSMLESGGRERAERALAEAGRTAPVLLADAQRSGVLPPRRLTTVRLDSWDSFQKEMRNRKSLGAAGQRVQRIFRGQGRTDWQLQTEVERSRMPQLIPDPTGTATYDSFRRHYLDRFRELASPHLDPSTQSFDDSQWWMLGRHYGLITPLLDWSRSPYVAAFFAFTQYAREVSPGWIDGRLDAELDVGADDHVAVWRLAYRDDTWRDGELELLAPLSGGNARQTAQQGVLTLKRYLGVLSLEEYLEGRNRGDALTKFEIPARDIQEALHDLLLMNITFATLFPGPEGAALLANVEGRLGRVWDKGAAAE